MPNLVKKVQNTIFQHNLLNRGAKIILAVSGGPDSVCLLDVFRRLQKKYSWELIVVHINYGLRGKDSDADEKLVRALAEKYDFKIFVKNIKTTLRGKKISENYLRDIRYAFFEKIRQDNNFDFIAVAHNTNDQAETFLMRLIRGAGLQGLSAMQFKNEFVIRPLLNISRQEILEYLKKNKLDWHLDKTNLESKFLRNKIRNKLIPYLEKNYNPKIKRTIFDSTASIAEDCDFIAQAAEKTFRSFPELKVSKIIKLHPAMQRKVLMNAIMTEKKDLKNIEFSHIEEILKIIKSTKSKLQVVLFEGLKIKRRGDKLEINKL